MQHPWHEHKLALNTRRSGWGCAGRRQFKGCRGTGGGSGYRRRCDECDFDLCKECWEMKVPFNNTNLFKWFQLQSL